MLPEEIAQVKKFINDGDPRSAIAFLNGLVKRNQKDVDAWFLLAVLAPTNAHKRDYLRYVIDIDPQHAEAKKMLEQLDAKEQLSVYENPGEREQINQEQSNLRDEENSLLEYIDLNEGVSPQNFKSVNGPWSTKKIQRWDHPFSSEQEVISQFESLIESLIKLVENSGLQLNNEQRKLHYALECFDKWKKEQQGGTNFFLSPAHEAGINIALSFSNRNLYSESAWIINTFAEIGKILVCRRKDKYLERQVEYYRLYCLIVCKTYKPVAKVGDREHRGEIYSLYERLTGFVNFILETHYRDDHSRFEDVNFVDQDLASSLINDSIAQHFDSKLHYLVENERPRVWDYAASNMPFVYRLPLSEKWTRMIGDGGEWEKLLIDVNLEDSLRNLRSTGALIIPSRVGEIDANHLAQLRNASAQEDFQRARDLLRSTADEVRAYLAMIAREHLDYREPPFPHFANQEAKRDFYVAKNMLQKGQNEPALERIKELWMDDVSNLGLREWTAYAYLKFQNPSAAEPILTYLQNNRNLKANQVTNWNFAVILYERGDNAGAYNLLQPLLDVGLIDDSLLEVVLALSLVLKKETQFLEYVPKTRHLRFYPLAYVLAFDLRDVKRQKDILTQLLFQPGANRWELPPIDRKFDKLDELKAITNRAVVENQLDQLVEWLNARVKSVPSYIPNYLELARAYELRSEIDLAYKALFSRLEQQKKANDRRGNDARSQRYLDEACRELLDFCKRYKRPDLGRLAYKKIQSMGGNQDLLNAYPIFKDVEDPRGKFDALITKFDNARKSRPYNQQVIDAAAKQLFEYARAGQDNEMFSEALRISENGGVSSDILRLYTESQPETISKPKLGEGIPAKEIVSSVPQTFFWVNSELQRIRTVATYVESKKAVKEFLNIINTIAPIVSDPVIKLIEDFSNAVETFSLTTSDQTDQRRVLYARISEYDKRLGSLLSSTVLPSDLLNLLKPYYSGTFQAVLGDLFRQAGVGPNINAEVENSFISLACQRSVLVVRLTNISERPITSGNIQLMVDGSDIRLIDRNERRLSLMQPGESILLTFPYERNVSISPSHSTDVVVNIALYASSEGYPNVNLGDIRKAIPVKNLEQAIGRSSIPLLFQSGSPLSPADSQLFKGREELLTKIKDSFFGNTQREKYFLDGIRRVGKTSLLNFIPFNLPANLIPVKVNFEGMGIEVHNFTSASFLYSLCELIWQALPETEGMPVPPPNEERFRIRPGSAFKDFFDSVNRSYEGKKVFLMIDEFQVLLSLIRLSQTQDSLVLDQLRDKIDEKVVYAIFTGSTRHERLTDLFNHRIVGSLTRLRISFLSESSVGDVIRAGMQEWVKVPPETIKKIFEMTGGYPRLVHIYGSHLVDLLNSQQRTVVTPDDAEIVTQEHILNNNELFSHWWPSDQLGSDEEMFIEHLFRKFKDRVTVTTNEFMETVSARDQQAFRRALDNLRAYEVLDSTHLELIQFRGSVIRSWIELHTDPITGQFQPPRSVTLGLGVRGENGIFIDHENMMKSLENIGGRKGVPLVGERIDWFRPILQNLLKEAENRIGHLDYKIAVAFFNRPHEAALIPLYTEFGISTITPISVDKKNQNAADFKLADEINGAVNLSMQKGTRLQRAIVLTGDGDLGQTVNKLKNNGVQVQVWGGSKETKELYVSWVGADNVKALDDVCGL